MNKFEILFIFGKCFLFYFGKNERKICCKQETRSTKNDIRCQFRAICMGQIGVCTLYTF